MQKQIHYGLMATAIVALLASALPADAQRRGGGGGRAAATSIQRPGGGGQMSHANAGNLNTGNRANAGNVNANNRVNTGNVNANNRVNTGNVNVGNTVNTGNINVNVDQGWNAYPAQPIYRGGAVVAPVRPVYHPVAAGVAIGTAAAVTAAAIGSMAYALPGGCNPYPYAAYTYYSCGSVWYKPQYQGDSVVYVVVTKPG